MIPAAVRSAEGTARPSAAEALAAAEVWVFDLDNTLYPASCDLFAQVDERMCRFICEQLRLERDAARILQKQYYREHGTTLSGLMANHGIAPLDFLEFVHEIDVTPVPPSPALGSAIAALPGRKIVFTNGSVRHAENVMERLGIGDLFEGIFDIVAADYRAKPDPAAYDKLVRSFWFDPRGAVMVEDIARNLVPAHALGMTTVWVENDRKWSADGIDGGHIDVVVQDLAHWLRTACPQCETSAPIS